MGILDEQFGVVTRPYEGGLGKDECVVVHPKHQALLDAMNAFGLLKDTGKTVPLGRDAPKRSSMQDSV